MLLEVVMTVDTCRKIRKRENDVKEPCEVQMQSSLLRGMCGMGWRNRRKGG